MAIAKWSALSSESADLGTSVDNKSSSSTPIFIADIDNSSGATLYIEYFINFASINPTAGASITLVLRRKRGSSYAENNIETYTASPTGSGARAFSLHAAHRILNAGVYGLYWINNLGVTTAASGNNLFYRTWNEDVS